MKTLLTTSHGTARLVLVVKMGFGSTSEIKSGHSWGHWFGFSLSIAYWRFRYWLTIKSYQTVWQCYMALFVLLRLLVTQKQHLQIPGLYHKKQSRGRRWWEKALQLTPCAAIVKRTNPRILIIAESATDVSVVWITTAHGWTTALELIISVSNFIWMVWGSLAFYLSAFISRFYFLTRYTRFFQILFCSSLRTFHSLSLLYMDWLRFFIDGF